MLKSKKRNRKIEKSLVRKINERPLIIYGAGIIGKRFFQWTKHMGIDNYVLKFVVTSLKDNPIQIESITVEEIEALQEVTEDVCVIVAASEVMHEDMIRNLGSTGHSNYLLIDNEINQYLIEYVKQCKPNNLYMCQTYYHVLISLIKIILFEQSADIIFAAATLADKCDIGYNLLKSGYVNNVIYNAYCNVTEIYSESLILRKTICRKENIKSFEKSEMLDYKRYDNVYIFTDPNIFGRYLQNKKIRHHYIEDGMDLFKKNIPAYDKDLIKYWHSKKFILDYYLNLEYQVWGQSKYCKSIEVNDREGISLSKVNTKKIIETPKKELFAKLADEDKKKIYDIFLGDSELSIKCDGKSVLLLTEPLWELSFLDFKITKEIHGAVYRKIINEIKSDYDSIYIKPHPRDDYLYEITGVEIIEKDMPIEIMNFSQEISFDKAVTIASSSIRGLECVKEKETLGIQYLEQFAYLAEKEK